MKKKRVEFAVEDVDKVDVVGSCSKKKKKQWRGGLEEKAAEERRKEENGNAEDNRKPEEEETESYTFVLAWWWVRWVDFVVVESCFWLWNESTKLFQSSHLETKLTFVTISRLICIQFGSTAWWMSL